MMSTKPLEALSDEDLKNVSVLEARSIVVNCFLAAQRETFARAAHALGNEGSEDQLKRAIEGAVRLAFRATKGDFERPTRQSLMNAVDSLAMNASAMGTPADIIEKHRAQLSRVFAALRDEPFSMAP